MGQYIVRRLVGVGVSVFVVAIMVFVLTNLIPGSPVTRILGEEATEESIAHLEHVLGLDRPVGVRFYLWIKDLLRGNLGESLYNNRTVGSVLLSRLEPTALITVFASIVAVLIGIPLGIVAAVFQGRVADTVAVTISLIGISTPFFWLGLNAILIFSLMLGWVPAASYVRLDADIYQNIKHLVLPVLTLGFHHAGSIARMTRANLLEVLREDYVRTARSKGVSEPSVILRHVFRSAIVPTLSVIGLVIALIIGGSPVIETVFAIPGVGRLMVTSVLRRDFPMIQGVVLLIAVSMALVNLVVDLTYALFDPRITYS